MPTATGYGAGGGGAGGRSNTTIGGGGGKGVVIISVPTASTLSTQVSTSGNNPAGLICSVHDSTGSIAYTNSDWTYSLSTTASSSTTSNYFNSGANEYTETLT
jgi:hypothetical protein